MGSEQAQNILVTGVAGFIGSYTAKRLLDLGHTVVGIDNLNAYYSPQLKHDRLETIPQEGFTFRKLDLVDVAGMMKLFEEFSFDRVIHLAAQAGVRYSMENPHAYVDSNVTGFLNILEGCRKLQVPHLVYASSSSVYGANTAMPFSTQQCTSHQISLYAATKKANEAMAHSYSASYRLPVTGLRFFTVYGPWGRPDMALYQFAKAIMRDEPVRVFNEGRMLRDFTFIQDIVEGVVRIMDQVPQGDPSWNGNAPNPASSFAPYRIFNLGNHSPVQLGYFIELIERNLNKKATLELLPMQVGDVPATFADVQDLHASVGYAPSTPIEEGLAKSLEWYLDYRTKNSDV